MSWSWIK